MKRATDGRAGRAKPYPSSRRAGCQREGRFTLPQTPAAARTGHPGGAAAGNFGPLSHLLGGTASIGGEGTPGYGPPGMPWPKP